VRPFVDNGPVHCLKSHQSTLRVPIYVVF